MSIVPSYLSRAYRGGSWASGARLARAAIRSALHPSCRRVILGLRLMRRTP
jgi:formylglycine-generating enzyme required for sulfatase activity